MPGRRGIFGLLLATPLLVAASCNEPYTRFGDAAPSLRAAEPPAGHAVWAAVLERLILRFDGVVTPPDAEVTRAFLRVLRRAAVFSEVEGPEATGRPGAARLVLRSEHRLHPRSAGNAARAVLIGASLTLLRPVVPYRFDLEGEMELQVWLPGEAQPRLYRSWLRATGFHPFSSQYPEVLRTLRQEVTAENLRLLVAELRRDRALTAGDPGPIAPP